MPREARKTHVSDTVSPKGIVYQLVRTKVKNLNLRVRPDGTVRVSAPGRVSVAEVNRFVDSRAAWIASRQELMLRRSERASTNLTEGDTVRLWGRRLPVRLEVVAQARLEGAAIEDEALVLRVRKRWADADDAAREHRAKLVDAFLRLQLQEVMTPLFTRYERQMGVHASAVRIRRMRTRWGSCATKSGAITMNLQLAELPPACLEGVVVHELCHLVEANHGPRFYALMEQHYPAWREARAMLKAAARE